MYSLSSATLWIAIVASRRIFGICPAQTEAVDERQSELSPGTAELGTGAGSMASKAKAASVAGHPQSRAGCRDRKPALGPTLLERPPPPVARKAHGKDAGRQPPWRLTAASRTHSETDVRTIEWKSASVGSFEDRCAARAAALCRPAGKVPRRPAGWRSIGLPGDESSGLPLKTCSSLTRQGSRFSSGCSSQSV